MDIKERATELHHMGYNCAQSVFVACGEYTGLDEKQRVPMLAMAGGRNGTTFVRAGQLANATVPISSSVSGRSTSPRFGHEPKAEPPMDVSRLPLKSTLLKAHCLKTP